MRVRLTPPGANYVVDKLPTDPTGWQWVVALPHVDMMSARETEAEAVRAAEWMVREHGHEPVRGESEAA